MARDPLPRPEITVPIVHLNGTGRETLIAQRLVVYDALGQVERLLREMAPNGRDYYPAGPAAMEAAIAQHTRRARAIAQLRDEIEHELQVLDDC